MALARHQQLERYILWPRRPHHETIGFVFFLDDGTESRGAFLSRLFELVGGSDAVGGLGLLGLFGRGRFRAVELVDGCVEGAVLEGGVEG